MKHTLLLATMAAAGLVMFSGAQSAERDPYLAEQLEELDTFNANGAWKTTWESLTKHEIPEWFADAKLGIYAHLGVYCVPAYGTEWYPSMMYKTDNAAHKYHVETYGDPSKFGYKDFIGKFTLEKFDPAEWAQLYKDAGAKFAGPVAEHHDGFSMWASKVNRWNAANMGPKRDVAGELIAELRKRDLKIITSFHHAFNIQGYYTAAEGWDTADPQYGDLYGFPTMSDRTRALDRWLVKLKEVVDTYQPDQIWFDFGLGKIPDDYKQRFCAYYYNHEKTWGKPLIITRKDDYLPEGVGALDIERGRMKDTGKELWQTDDSSAYSSWSWVKDLRVKPAEEMVHELIDIVSKNGVLLLNVCPKADGTITAEQQQMLRQMGRWLKVNGEAIYATRPWRVFGEGPTRMERGGAFLDTITYTPQDIRYTHSKDGKTLYAIALGWPQKGVSLEFVQVNSAGPDAKVILLGHDRPLPFTVSDRKHLEIQVPALSEDQRPCRHAYAFRISGFEIDLSPDARFSMPGAIELPADRAVLEGEQIRTQGAGDDLNVGYWDNASERIHWLAYVPQADTYDIVGQFATVHSQSALTLEVADKSLPFTVANTGGWEDSKRVEIGRVRFDKPGVYHLVLRPTEGQPWRPANVWKIQLAPVG